jgi:hypothetical protein
LCLLKWDEWYDGLVFSCVMSKGGYKDGCVDLGKSLFEFILYECNYVEK